MSRRAWIYIWSVLLVGVALCAWALWSAPPAGDELPTFLAFVAFATLAQLYTARAPGHQSYHFTLVFLLAGALLLNPSLFVLVVAIPHLVEWVRERWTHSPRLRNWYLQPFNIATHVIAGLAARWAFILLNGETTRLVSITSLVAAVWASIVYVLLNHVLVGIAISTARKVSLRKSGVLDVENLVTDWILLVMGVTVAVAWTSNPWLILPALAPIALMYQALKVPQLTQEAKMDPKTGLANARHLTELFTNELKRAKRFGRPLSVIMSDLDLLRNVNNTYGHLAGDAVLVGIGQILRAATREYDIAGRFGGEEFVLVLPETQLQEAHSISERICETIEATGFQVPTSPIPIHVTMSFGIACFPKDADSINDLIHQADIAVYQAKLKGRNRVVCVQDVPHSIRLDTAPREERVAAPAIPTFTPRPEIPPPNHTPPAPQPPVETTETHLPLKPVPQPPSHYKVLFPLLLVLVVTSGLVLAVWGWIQGRQTDMTTMGLLIGLALLAQMPQVKNLYGESSVSVSMAVNFAAALLAGIPGITAVSAVIALVHYIQRKPLLYKTAYNWAVHVLAGTVPVFVVSLVPNPFQLPNLLWLAVLCIGTALAFYLIETGLIAAGISFSERADVLSTWRGTFQWLAPQYLGLCFMGLVLSVAYTNLYLLGVLIVLMPILMMYVSQRQYVERTAESINELKRVNQELGLANREIVAASQTIRTINDELFLTLSKIIDARDPFVSGHSAQVAVYARAIAKAMGLSEERVQNVQQAALMHDIGKIAIDENVLNKPGRLDPQEYDYVKTHAAVGASFLETSQGLRHLAPFLRYHHERWDGTGYPDGLTGEQIPLEARILAICDAVETMASDRPYRRAMSLDEILAEIERCAATQFDPKVAETFIRLLEQDGARLVVNSARKVAQTKSDQEPGKHGEAGRTTSPRAADTPAEPTDLRGLVGNVAA